MTPTSIRPLDQINDTITGTTIAGEVFRSAYGSKQTQPKQAQPIEGARL